MYVSASNLFFIYTLLIYLNVERGSGCIATCIFHNVRATVIINFVFYFVMRCLDPTSECSSDDTLLKVQRPGWTPLLRTTRTMRDSTPSQTLCAAAAAAALMLTGLKLQLGLLSEEALGQGEAVPGGSALQHGAPVDGGEDGHQHTQQRPWNAPSQRAGVTGRPVYEGRGVPGSSLHLPGLSSLPRVTSRRSSGRTTGVSTHAAHTRGSVRRFGLMKPLMVCVISLLMCNCFYRIHLLFC